MGKPLLYFLCTGNACRSQMAEGFARHFGGDIVEVHSAGVEMHGLNPRAVESMRAVGVDISKQVSKLIDIDLLGRADYVITLCGDANDKCPTTPPHVKRLHWGFEDPARATGLETEIRAAFAKTRDAIQEKVRLFIEEVSD